MSLAYAIGPMVALIACNTHRTVDRPTAERLATPLAQLAAAWPHEEHSAWDVTLDGVLVGSATLDLGPERADTVFATDGLAALVAKAARFELVTLLANGQPREARELVILDRRSERRAPRFVGAGVDEPDRERVLVPGGSRVHTVHTALVAVRMWARAAVSPAGDFLWMWSRGTLYRLDVFAPTADDVHGQPALRIDGVVRAPSLAAPIAITLWLGDDSARTPRRLAIHTAHHRIIAVAR
jgi:hypothetical protein